MRMLIPKISEEEGAQIWEALVRSGFVDLTRSIIKEQRAKYALCEGVISQRCQNCKHLIEVFGAPNQCALRRLADLNML